MIISVLFLFLVVPLLGIYDSSFPHIIKKIGAKCKYFKNNSYLCGIARLAHLWAAGGLIYEKDVFERLSLWFVNFANSNLYNRQMTTRRLRSAFLYTINIVRTGVG